MNKKEIVEGLVEIKKRDGGNFFSDKEINIIDSAIQEFQYIQDEKIEKAVKRVLGRIEYDPTNLTIYPQEAGCILKMIYDIWMRTKE